MPLSHRHDTFAPTPGVCASGCVRACVCLWGKAPLRHTAVAERARGVWGRGRMIAPRGMHAVRCASAPRVACGAVPRVACCAAPRACSRNERDLLMYCASFSSAPAPPRAAHHAKTRGAQRRATSQRATLHHGARPRRTLQRRAVPFESVLATRSEPARSTRFSLEYTTY